MKLDVTGSLGTLGTDEELDAFDCYQAVDEDRLLTLPDGTEASQATLRRRAVASAECVKAFAAGVGTWRHLLEAAAAKVAGENDPSRLCAALFELATVTEAWTQALCMRDVLAERQRSLMAVGEAVA